MEEFSLYRREEDSDAFTDLLFNTLLGFAFMFFLAFALIRPEDAEGKIEANAEFIISVRWPDRHPDDIDVYVENPAGNLVWYHVRDSGLMHLDRDDRGNYRDVIIVDGEERINPLNQETVSVRGVVPGEYVVNIVHYLATSPDPVPVEVKVEKINPRVSVLYYETIMLERTGHEETAVRFEVGADGGVSQVSTRAKSLVKLSRGRAGAKAPGAAPQAVPTDQGIVIQR